jgi:hypothetical protein
MRTTTTLVGSMQRALVLSLVLLIGSMSQTGIASAQVLERTLEGGAIGAVVGAIAGGGRGAGTGAAIGAGIGFVAGAAEANSRHYRYHHHCWWHHGHRHCR